VETKLDWDEIEEKTPVSVSSPTKFELETLNRVLFNEVGEVSSIELENEAIALLYAIYNLSQRTCISIPKLLTGYKEPELEDYCPKHIMLKDGRLSIVSTELPSSFNYSKLIGEVLTGAITDPLYGEFEFFNCIEELHPDIYRRRWGIGETCHIKTGIIYGKFEYCPLGFLSAKNNNKADIVHIAHWRKQVEEPYILYKLSL
jgi:hypothetical protein